MWARPSGCSVSAATPVHDVGPRLAGFLVGGRHMKGIALGALAALGLSVQLVGQQPVSVHANTDDRVTLVGCVIKGDGGSVLSSVADTWGTTSAGSAATTVTSASKVAGRIF